MQRASGPESSVTSSVTRAELLAMKVSTILGSLPGSLDVLIEHGFAPLKQPHLRAVLAPTLTLSQAVRIRSLAAAQQQALLDELLALITTAAAPAEAVSPRTLN